MNQWYRPWSCWRLLVMLDLKLLLVLPLVALLDGCASGVALFDGGTLDGWQQVGEAAWSVEQGEIVASGTGQGFLATTDDFGDFHLTLEFWVDATTNSGVFIRCRDREKIHPETCYELNIWDEHPRQEARTGSIVFNVMPPLAHVDTVGRWNTFDVVAQGGSLTVSIDDQVTAVMEQAAETAGFIALQHFEQGTVKFRNIRIRIL